MSLPLRVLVCDDEAISRKRARRLLDEIGDVEVVRECASGEEVLTALGEEEIDLALLDINMPGLTGIETIARMPEERPYIIFVTAHPEHALTAFDIGVTDYLLKPVDATRLRKALDRAKKQLDRAAVAVMDLPRLAVTTRGRVLLVDPHEVTHVVFDGQLVTLHTRSRALLLGETLQELEAKLAGSHFERVHRRAIVNLLEVEELAATATGGYVAKMRGGATVEVSRQAARKLRRRLGIR